MIVGDAEASDRSNGGGVELGISTEGVGDEFPRRFVPAGEPGVGEERGTWLICRGDDDFRGILGGGEGLSCALIIRLAMADDGSIKDKGFIFTEPDMTRTILRFRQRSFYPFYLLSGLR